MKETKGREDTLEQIKPSKTFWSKKADKKDFKRFHHYRSVWVNGKSIEDPRFRLMNVTARVDEADVKKMTKDIEEFLEATLESFQGMAMKD